MGYVPFLVAVVHSSFLESLRQYSPSVIRVQPLYVQFLKSIFVFSFFSFESLKVLLLLIKWLIPVPACLRTVDFALSRLSTSQRCEICARDVAKSTTSSIRGTDTRYKGGAYPVAGCTNRT